MLTKFLASSVALIPAAALAAAAPLESLQQLIQTDAPLKDPFSVRLKDVKHVEVLISDEPTAYFCGQYNAKNSWGAYAGWERFLLIKRDGEPAKFLSGGDQFGVIVLEAVCGKSEDWKVILDGVL